MASLLESVRNLLHAELFQVGGTPVTLSTLLTTIAIVIAAVVISRVLDRAVRRALGTRGVHAGTVGAITKLLHYLVLIVGWSIALQTIGINLTALFAAGAVFAVGIGFAMKNIAENFVSGVILLVERSIRPDDILQINNSLVTVRKIGIRATLVRTRDGEDIIIPNGNLVQADVKNYTLSDSVFRIWLTVGVSYDSDMNHVHTTLQNAMHLLLEDHPVFVSNRPTEVLMAAFGESSVNFEVGVWLSDPNQIRPLRAEVAMAIWQAFQDTGIVISFPQMDVHFDQSIVQGLSALFQRDAA